MTNDDKACRHVLEHLRDVFAEMPQGPAAIRTMLPVGKMRVHLTAKMFRKSAALANRGWLRSGSGRLRELLWRITPTFLRNQAQG